ncbi:hypothetical protein QTP70_021714, partial [Hemibagrus guttatus]
MKCLERLVMRHIKTQLPPSLDPLQFAYCPNRSMDDAITSTPHLALTHLDINSFINCLPLIRSILGSRGACAYLRHHWASRQDTGVPTHRRSANPSQGTHTLSFTHAITHYGQFRDANQPTTHVFGLGEETGVPEGNPRGTGRTCKLHTHMAKAGIEPPTLEFSIQHNHPSAPDREAESAGHQHLPLQLDPGLPDWETSVSPDREQHLQHHHTEHWSSSGLRAQSTAVHYADSRLCSNADDTTVVGLISKNDGSAYRKEVQRLTAWCKTNNLSLNVEKTKEMVVDFRRAQSDHSPLNINESNMEIIKSTANSLVFTWRRTSPGHSTPAPSPAASLLPEKAEEGSSSTSNPDHLLQRDHREHPEQLHHCLVRELHRVGSQDPAAD